MRDKKISLSSYFHSGGRQIILDVTRYESGLNVSLQGTIQGNIWTE